MKEIYIPKTTVKYVFKHEEAFLDMYDAVTKIISKLPRFKFKLSE